MGRWVTWVPERIMISDGLRRHVWWGTKYLSCKCTDCFISIYHIMPLLMHAGKQRMRRIYICMVLSRRIPNTSSAFFTCTNLPSFTHTHTYTHIDRHCGNSLACCWFMARCCQRIISSWGLFMMVLQVEWKLCGEVCGPRSGRLKEGEKGGRHKATWVAALGIYQWWSWHN